MAKKGDIVRFLNAVGGGRITRIEGQIAYVDEDGFETPVLLKECVVVGEAENQLKAEPAREEYATSAPKVAKPEPELPPVIETEAGEKLNIMVAYEAADIKRISTTTFDAFLVNDSNYYIYYIYMTRGKDASEWTLRSSGQVEPATQVFLGEVLREDLAEMDHVAVQYVAFKRGKDFALKPSVSVERRLDTTKFFKLHCFRPNMYFDEPVIALEITEDDRPYRQVEVNTAELEAAMRAKSRADRQAPRPVRKKAQKTDGPLVVDLHIAELVETTAGMSNADMLNLQIDHFRKVMDENLRNHGKVIVFIHGKGEGVLRQALLKELNHRYKGNDVQDASFREYGFGATQVKIK